VVCRPTVIVLFFDSPDRRIVTQRDLPTFSKACSFLQSTQADDSLSPYRGRDHHRLDHVYFARTDHDAPQVALRHTANGRAGLIERRWRPAAAVSTCRNKLLPAKLPDLLRALLDDRFPLVPLALTA
jgi:hypothetical protein